MSEGNIQEKESHVYRVQGLSCAGCAKTFEQNVKDLDGVMDAKINFGASKLTVVGETSIKALNKAGAFDKLQVLPEKSKEVIPKKTVWEKYSTLFTALFFLVLGYISQTVYGEESKLTTIAFLLTILVGGYPVFITGFKI